MVQSGTGKAVFLEGRLPFNSQGAEDHYALQETVHRDGLQERDVEHNGARNTAHQPGKHSALAEVPERGKPAGL